jgi:hypothetical protein
VTIPARAQHADRSVPEEAASILAQGLVAHVAFSLDGQPYVIPFSYQYDSSVPDRLYLHGSPESRALTHLASGAAVCVEVCLLDGLIYSRTALYHSMNYRSTVCFGRSRAVGDEALKREVLRKMIARYFEGRTEGRDYEAPPTPHLDTTALLEISIEEWSAKARLGGPKGPRDADPDAPGSAGILDLREGAKPAAPKRGA